MAAVILSARIFASARHWSPVLGSSRTTMAKRPSRCSCPRVLPTPCRVASGMLSMSRILTSATCSSSSTILGARRLGLTNAVSVGFRSSMAARVALLSRSRLTYASFRLSRASEFGKADFLVYFGVVSADLPR